MNGEASIFRGAVDVLLTSKLVTVKSMPLMSGCVHYIYPQTGGRSIPGVEGGCPGVEQGGDLRSPGLKRSRNPNKRQT